MLLLFSTQILRQNKKDSSRCENKHNNTPNNNFSSYEIIAQSATVQSSHSDCGYAQPQFLRECTVSCFCKIQTGFTFLVPAHSGSPGQTAVKWVCVCVCVRACVRVCVCVCVCLIHTVVLYFSNCASLVKLCFSFLMWIIYKNKRCVHVQA